MAQKQIKSEAEEFDFEAYRQKVIQGLIKGEPLTGEGGLLKPLIAQFIEGALSAEMDDHLSQQRQEGLKNKRNGGQSKSVRTTVGEVAVQYSRDRTGTFEPVTVKKRSQELALGFEDQIL